MTSRERMQSEFRRAEHYTKENINLNLTYCFVGLPSIVRILSIVEGCFRKLCSTYSSMKYEMFVFQCKWEGLGVRGAKSILFVVECKWLQKLILTTYFLTPYLGVWVSPLRKKRFHGVSTIQSQFFRLP